MTTRVHHLNCATFAPRGFGRFVAHVLLVERPGGLLLVDSGLGTADLADPRRLGRSFRTMMKPVLDPAEPARRQVQALGLDPDDVTDVVLTHLDLDHAGGIGDFPDARVHVHERELEAATRPHLQERMRYLSAQWSHDPQWVTHREEGDRWLGLESVTVLDDDVVLVPLHGHSRGHAGVAVKRPDGASWLLHAGDSYFDAGDVLTPPAGSRALGVLQSALAVDNPTRRHNQERLRDLRAAHGSEVTVFSAHDAGELAVLQASAEV